MTPREIARIEAVSLELREESLAARARAAHEPRALPSGAGVESAAAAWNAAVAPQTQDVAKALRCSMRQANALIQAARAEGLIRSRVGQWEHGRSGGKRGIIGEDVYRQSVAHLLAHPDAVASEVARAIGASRWTVKQALGRARRAGELPPALGYRIAKSDNPRAVRERKRREEMKRRGLAAEGSRA